MLTTRPTTGDIRIQRLYFRRRFLLIRREEYCSRLHLLSDARARHELPLEGWKDAVERVLDRIEAIDDEIAQVEAALRGVQRLLDSKSPRTRL